VKLKSDLHIHSCLSPCGDLDLSPANIVQKAKEKKLNLIALTDHNSALNCEVTAKICATNNIQFIYGIEVTTIEEVHILCYFDKLRPILKLSNMIYKKLPNIKNYPEKFGDQVYVNNQGVILGTIKKYLVSAANISINELIQYVNKYNGIVIPAHVNRPLYGIIPTLGFLPEVDFTAIEISKFYKQGKYNLKKYPKVTNSDAHYLKDIGTRYNNLEINGKATIDKLKKAISLLA